jgi:hypothetical protein
MQISKRSKVWIIGLSIVVVLVIGFKVAEYFTQQFFLGKLTELIDNRPESVYHYSFDSLNVDLWRGAVSLTGVQILPKKSLIDSVNNTTNETRMYVVSNV